MSFNKSCFFIPILLLIWLLLFTARSFVYAGQGGVTISLWHAYRGREKTALEKVAQSFNLSHDQIRVKLLAVPFDAFSDKLNATIPLGTGPDVFIAGSSSTGFNAESGFILPLDSMLTRKETEDFFPLALQSFSYLYPGSVWALPANTKTLALFYNKALIKNPPNNMKALIHAAKDFTRPHQSSSGRWGLAYEAGNFYYHALWLHAFGGLFLRFTGRGPKGIPRYQPEVNSSAMRRSLNYVKKLFESGIMPPEPSNVLVTRLFNTGMAMFVINGQWFRGEIDNRIHYGVMPVPQVAEGKNPHPFLTVEGYYLSSCAKDQKASLEVIRYFSSAAMQKVMATVGKHTPTRKKAFHYSVVKNDKINRVFVSIAKTAVPLPNCPETSLAWGPYTSALNDWLGGKDTLKQRQRELLDAIAVFKKKFSDR